MISRILGIMIDSFIRVFFYKLFFRLPLKVYFLLISMTAGAAYFSYKQPEMAKLILKNAYSLGKSLIG